MAGTVRKLSFSEGADVGAPTDLAISSATAGAYTNDAGYVADKGTAVDGSYYVNTTSNVIKYYSNAAWRTALSDALADGTLLVGNASGVATAVTPTGDVTITNAGVTAIGSAKVTNGMLAGSIGLSKLATITAFRVLGAAADGVVGAREIDGDINVPVWSSGKITLRIVADTITDAMVKTTAAIAGTKITPDFGSQNVLTTGLVKVGSQTATAGKLDVRDTTGTPDTTATGLAFFHSASAGYVSVFENSNGTAAGGGIWIDTRWNTSDNYILRLTTNSGATPVFDVKGDRSAVFWGNVGVGKVPTLGLDVEKAGGGNYVAKFKNTTNATPYTVLIEEPASPTAGYPLLMLTNSAGTVQYFRVDSAGQVRIGGATALASTQVTINGGSNYCIGMTRENTVGTVSITQHIDGAGTVCGTISMDTSGNTTAYNTSSDERLKTNHREYSGLAIIKALISTMYERLANPGVDECGVVAQQAYHVFPQAVLPGGEDPDKEPWQVDYSKFVGPLIKAVQELEARLSSIEAAI